jgi:hypothetical protein
MKTYWGVEIQLHSFFDLGIRLGMFSFTPRALYPQIKSTWYQLDRIWLGPRAGLDTMVKRKIPSPRRESNPDHPLYSP